MIKGKLSSDSSVYIRKGISKKVIKSMLGTSAGGIIDVMYRDFEVRSLSMRQTQRLAAMVIDSACVGMTVLNENGQRPVMKRIPLYKVSTIL